VCRQRPLTGADGHAHTAVMAAEAARIDGLKKNLALSGDFLSQ
jgi:hypothetical protein